MDSGDWSVGIPSTQAQISIQINMKDISIADEHPDNISLFVENLKKNLELITPFDTCSTILTKDEYDRQIAEDHRLAQEIHDQEE
ncbi:MAG: hypothetical protein ACTSWW_01635 [Promethearchaeota archaeon]